MNNKELLKFIVNAVNKYCWFYRLYCPCLSSMISYKSHSSRLNSRWVSTSNNHNSTRKTLGIPSSLWTRVKQQGCVFYLPKLFYEQLFKPKFELFRVSAEHLPRLQPRHLREMNEKQWVNNVVTPEISSICSLTTFYVTSAIVVYSFHICRFALYSVVRNM